MTQARTLPLMHRLNTDVTVFVKPEMLISTGWAEFIVVMVQYIVCRDNRGTLSCDNYIMIKAIS